MDSNRIKDENTFKDPIFLEITSLMVGALIGIIQIVHYHENNRHQEIENNRHREFEVQLDMIKFAVSNLEKLSDDIMELLTIVASHKRFNIDGKVTFKDTLLSLRQNEYLRYLMLENKLRQVENEINHLKNQFRYSAIENKLNLDINGNDPLIKNFDSLLSNMDEMNIVEFMTGLNDSISESSNRLAELGNPPLK